MAAVAGRTPKPRTQSIGTTSTDATITGSAGTFREEDVGRAITATGIPASTTILSVTSDTSAELSANATATATVTATLGGDAASAYGFYGWSPETDAESETYTLLAKGGGATSPDQLADAVTGVAQRTRA